MQVTTPRCLFFWTAVWSLSSRANCPTTTSSPCLRWSWEWRSCRYPCLQTYNLPTSNKLVQRQSGLPVTGLLEDRALDWPTQNIVISKLCPAITKPQLGEKVELPVDDLVGKVPAPQKRPVQFESPSQVPTSAIPASASFSTCTCSGELRWLAGQWQGECWTR